MFFLPRLTLDNKMKREFPFPNVPYNSANNTKKEIQGPNELNQLPLMRTTNRLEL